MSGLKEYAEVPEYVPAVYKDGMPIVADDGALIWAGKVPPPPVGEIIRVSMNSLGNGEVVGYFSLEGYLGLLVKLSNPPEWYVKQNNGNVIGHIFGPEFAPLEQ